MGAMLLRASVAAMPVLFVMVYKVPFFIYCVDLSTAGKNKRHMLDLTRCEFL